jgi:cell wall-associated NlpC family hydrolase
MSWANGFAGIPYEPQGRTQAGCDCWGLYRLAVQDRTGISLPLWDTIDPRDGRAVARTLTGERCGEDWLPVDDPRDGDLVLLRGAYAAGDGQLRGGPVHVGCFVAPAAVLHVEEGIDAVIVPVTHPSVRQRILGYYRHRSIP